MLTLGIYLVIGGIGIAIYGNYLNNSLEAQLNSMIQHGTRNPGDLFFFGGIVAIIIGAILIYRDVQKNKTKK